MSLPSFNTTKEVEAREYVVNGTYTNFSDFQTSPTGQAVVNDGEMVILQNDQFSVYNPFGYFSSSNFKAGKYLWLNDTLQAVEDFIKEDVVVVSTDVDLANLPLVPNKRYTLRPGAGLNVTATALNIRDIAGAIQTQPIAVVGGEYHYLEWNGTDFYMESEVAPVNEPAVVREDFEDGAGLTAGGNTLTVTAPIPDNVRVEVFRAGILVRNPDDYTLDTTTGIVTFVSPFVAGEKATVLWVVEGGSEFREDFSAPTLGATSLTPTINGGVLPTTTTNIRLWRQGVLLTEGAGNDYTIAGNIINLVSPVVAQDSFVLVINI